MRNYAEKLQDIHYLDEKIHSLKTGITEQRQQSLLLREALNEKLPAICNELHPLTKTLKRLLHVLYKGIFSIDLTIQNFDVQELRHEKLENSLYERLSATQSALEYEISELAYAEALSYQDMLQSVFKKLQSSLLTDWQQFDQMCEAVDQHIQRDILKDFDVEDCASAVAALKGFWSYCLWATTVLRLKSFLSR